MAESAPTQWISFDDAAEIIGCTGGRVRQMLAKKVIRGWKVNDRAWAVYRLDAERVAQRPASVGRPRGGGI